MVERACENCGAPLLGDYCYGCGQPVKGPVRHFSSILGDSPTACSTSMRAVPARSRRCSPSPATSPPGILFAGRRVRYVSPVRLFFVSIITFFVAQLTIGPAVTRSGWTTKRQLRTISSATTVAEVERERDAELADLARGEGRGGLAPGRGRLRLRSRRRAVRAPPANRIRQLQDAHAKGEPPPRSRRRTTSTSSRRQALGRADQPGRHAGGPVSPTAG
ncbi:MAG: DUF3667 domain-containing protein [Thermomonas sp.]|nr:DUF3667 domain-containing protein [Thermomonas sp.]